MRRSFRGPPSAEDLRLTLASSAVPVADGARRLLRERSAGS
ncbi:hypothetical protein [Ornithinimicrobium kibberense]